MRCSANLELSILTPTLSMNECSVELSTLCLKDTDVAQYTFNPHQLILVIFGRDDAERVHYRTMICYPTFRN